MYHTPNSYVVSKVFNSPKKGSNPLVFKLFNKGDIINGIETQNLNTKIVLTTDGYVIPFEYVTVNLGHNRPVVKTSANGQNTVETAKDVVNNSVPDFQKKIEAIKNTNVAQKVVELSNKHVRMATLGGVGGVGFAWVTGRSKLTWALIGLVAGGIVGSVLSSPKKVKSETNNKPKEKVNPEREEIKF